MYQISAPGSSSSSERNDVWVVIRISIAVSSFTVNELKSEKQIIFQTPRVQETGNVKARKDAKK